MKRRGLVGLLALLAAGCAAARSPSELVQPPAAAAPAGPATAGADQGFAAAFERAVREPSNTRLRIEVQGRRSGTPASLTIFGDGVGVWNRSRQIAVPTAALQRTLRLLERGGFTDFEPSYGGGESGRAQPPVVLHSIAVEVGDARKLVVQIARGEPFVPLAGLVEQILDVGAGLAATGVEIADLEAGLRRLADQSLSPNVWSVVFQTWPPATPTCDDGGFWLRLDRSRLSACRIDCAGGRGPARQLDLTSAEVVALAELFAARRETFLHRSLRSEERVELSLRILDRDLSLQGGPRVADTSAAAAANGLATVAAELRRLAERVLAEGEPAPAG